MITETTAFGCWSLIWAECVNGLFEKNLKKMEMEDIREGEKSTRGLTPRGK